MAPPGHTQPGSHHIYLFSKEEIEKVKHGKHIGVYLGYSL